MTDMNIHYGDGTTTDGRNEYGLLAFSEVLPTNNRKYRIKLPAQAIRDIAINTLTMPNNGPSLDMSWYVEAGELPGNSEDKDNPFIYAAEPHTTHSGPVPTSTDLVLHFNEDVQMGTGTVSFCLNSNAESDGTPPCTLGQFLDGSDVTYSSLDAKLDRRVVRLGPKKDWAIGQKLYMLLPTGLDATGRPTGLVKDTSLASNPMKPEKTWIKSYSFTVVDQDTVKPVMQHYFLPDAPEGQVRLYFSEAMQAAFHVNVSEILYKNAPSPDIDVELEIEEYVQGNEIVVKPGKQWTSGKKYMLYLAQTDFQDLAGNPVDPVTDVTRFVFSIDPDITPPTWTPIDWSTWNTSLASKTTVFALTFGEVVQRGTGKISVYSSYLGQDLGTQLEADVSSIPLVTEVLGGILMNKAVVNVTNGPLLQGHTYSLRIPSTAFMDLSKNPFTALNDFGKYYFTVTTNRDCHKPSFLAADFGPRGDNGKSSTPNPSFRESNGIVMYFTETVQGSRAGTVLLKDSDGKSFCSGTCQPHPHSLQTGQNYCSRSDGTCKPRVSCNEPCGYTAAPVPPGFSTSWVRLMSFKYEGNKVIAASEKLQVGAGYKLTITTDAFKDVVGNPMKFAIEGEDDWSVYPFSMYQPNPDSTGPQHATTGDVPPKLVSPFPTDGTRMVQPSTTVALTFSENVQAGSGHITFTGSIPNSPSRFTTHAAVSDCIFYKSSMTCDPRGDLRRKTMYSVSYTGAAVKDQAGNTLRENFPLGRTSNSRLEFTTIDLDYEAPRLTRVGGASFASRKLLAKPVDPFNQAETVAKSTVVALSFTETVQAGIGSVRLVMTPLPGPAVPDNEKMVSIDVDGSTPLSELHFQDKTVYIQKPNLKHDTAYSIETSIIGVFQDLSGNPVQHITSGYTFSVVPDDERKPFVLQYVPDHYHDRDLDHGHEHDTGRHKEVATTTDIILYFSEAVQAATGKTVMVDGVNIPVDNSDPAKGMVEIVHNRVTIDPFDDLPGGAAIPVFINDAAFTDLFGVNGVLAGEYKFQTAPFQLEELRQDNASNASRLLSSPPQVHGAFMYEFKNSSGSEYLMLFGGTNRGVCSSAGYTSRSGVKWQPFPSKVNGSIPWPLAFHLGTYNSTNFFNGSVEGNRNDWNGQVGFQFVARRNFTILHLGRSSAGSFSGTLNENATVTIWDVSTKTAIARANVGPTSHFDGNYYFETLNAPLFLQNGSTYRITQRTVQGMTPWYDGGPGGNLENRPFSWLSDYAEINRGVYSEKGYDYPVEPYVEIAFKLEASPSITFYVGNRIELTTCTEPSNVSNSTNANNTNVLLPNASLGAAARRLHPHKLTAADVLLPHRPPVARATRCPNLGTCRCPIAVAYAKTAQDEHSCVWMMDSYYCSDELGPGIIWRTCGIVGGEILWNAMPRPRSRGDSEWPYFENGIQGHAIAVVGGWQLVVVDAMTARVWKFLDKMATEVLLVADPAPFLPRADPILLTDSKNNLFLMAGYDMARCHILESSCPHVFTDVWQSSDSGQTWLCLTTNYDRSLTEQHSIGHGRFASGVAAHDDTLFLIGGAKPNATKALSTIWSSYWAKPDRVPPSYIGFKADIRSARAPAYGALGTEMVLTHSGITMYFSEQIAFANKRFVPMDSKPILSQISSLPISLVVNTDGGRRRVSFALSTSVSRQILSIAAVGGLPAGSTMKLKIQAGAMHDAAGNDLPEVVQEFFTDPDETPPAVVETIPMNESLDISGHMTLTLLVSEPVYPVGGVVNFTSNLSHHAAVPLWNALFVNEQDVGRTSRVHFDLRDAGDIGRLVDAADYTYTVPAGAFKDAAGNLNKEYQGRFFTINGNLSLNNYSNPMESQSVSLKSSYSIPLNKEDLTRPKFVSMWPEDGAGDVKCGAQNLFVHMFFNKPVKFNRTGLHIHIVNSSGNSTGTINMTYEHLEAEAKEEKALRSNASLAYRPDANGIRIRVGPFVKKGGTFMVSIPRMVIVDGNGLSSNPISKSFSCMEEKRDLTPPLATVVEPHGDITVDPTLQQVRVSFSEAIQAGKGNVTLQIQNKSKSHAVPIQDAHIVGARMTVDFPEQLGSKTGDIWNLLLPAGLVRDLGGNEFEGLPDGVGFRNIHGRFQLSVLHDNTAPTLSLVTETMAQNPDLIMVPHTEVPHGSIQKEPYMTAVSTALRMAFDEPVSKGQGFLSLRPKHTSPVINISVQSEEVQIIGGSSVVVVPFENILPGEVYLVTIDQGAFEDLAGNAFAGLASGWSFSTQPKINFRKEERPKISHADGHSHSHYHSDSGTHSHSHSHTNDHVHSHPVRDREFGPRFGAAVAVDLNNNLFIVGGHNSSGHPSHSMNDVWMSTTYKPVHCSSSVQPMLDCSTDGKPPGDTNKVTKCVCPAEGCKVPEDSFAGLREAETKIWKEPYSHISVWKQPYSNGKICVAKGFEEHRLGATLDTSMVKCPCPKCKNPPPGINNVFPGLNADSRPDFHNITDHKFTNFLPISGNDGTLPLECRDGGYIPSGDFTCELKTLYSARYKRSYDWPPLGEEWPPHPRCVLNPCYAPPRTPSNGQLIGCKPTQERPYSQGETCTYTCDPGYGLSPIGYGPGYASSQCGGSTGDPTTTTTTTGTARDRCDFSVTCHGGVWNWNNPYGCRKMSCSTAGIDTSSWRCDGRELVNETGGVEPRYKEACELNCLFGGNGPVYCELGPESPDGRPYLQPAPVCYTTTTTTTTIITTTTSTTTTSEPITTLPPGMMRITETFVTTNLTVTQDFGNATSESLAADVLFMSSVENGIVGGMGALGSPSTTDDVFILQLSLAALARRLEERSTYVPRTSVGRRLVPKTLTVQYKVRVANASVAQYLQIALADDTRRATFNSAFKEAYVASEIERTGLAPVVMVDQASKTDVSTEERLIVITTTTTSTATNATIPPPPPKAPEEEQIDVAMVRQIVGAMFGALAGTALVAGVFYLYMKGKQQATE